MMRWYPPPVNIQGPTLYLNQFGTGNTLLNVSGGFVGIGTSNPLDELQVDAGSGSGIRLNGNGNPVGFLLHNGATRRGLLAVAEGAGQWVGTSAAGDIAFAVSSTTNKLFLDTNNGTGTPVVTLAAANAGMGIKNATVTSYLHIGAGTATASTAPLKFTAGTVTTTAEAGAVEYDGSNFWATDVSTGRYALQKGIFAATADKTVGNTTTETTLFGTGVGSLTLPANLFIIGRTVRIVLRGYITGTANPTVRFKIKLGANIIVDTTALGTLLGAGTQHPFLFDGEIICRTTGASGAFVGQLVVASNAAANFVDGSQTTATVAADTTASQVLDATLAWGTANAANTVTITNATVELLR